MVSPTVWLVAAALALFLANLIVSRWPPKKSVNGVTVAFIPPLAQGNVSSDPKLDAHARASNTKIAQLFGRIENLEKRVQALELSFPRKTPGESKEKWLETVPLRKPRKSRK